ncbi:MAG: hypothetical protein RLP15_05330 [Cryomorphaceae bacterium]
MSRLPLICIPILLFSLLFLTPETKGQTAAQYISKGDKEQDLGYYQTAIAYYKKALRLDTNILEANFQTANAYRKLRNYKRSRDFYEATIAIDGQDQYPEAHFYKGLILKQLGKYKPAMLSFQTFLSMYKARDDLYRWARDEEVSCYWAIEHQNDSTLYEVHRPDSGLNTFHAEISPFLVDLQTLYFSTMRYESDEVKKNNPVYIEMKKAVNDSGRWELVPLDLPIAQMDMHIGNGVFNGDSTQFYYSRCAELYACQIWRTRKQAGIWQAPEALPEPINVPNSTSTQPALAQIGEDEYLIFSSNRDRGKGGMDLWFVPLKQGEPTSRLRNMGATVNSKGDDITPHFDSEDTTLYFSSNRHPGFGGFDIFKAKGVPGNSALPENLGPGLNSPADDYYMHLRSVDSVGYFASNRVSGLKKSGNETCCNDFYKIKVLPPPVELDTLITDSLNADSLLADAPEILEIENPQNLEELQTLLPISLYFHNDRPDPRTTSRTTQRTYAETLSAYLNMRFDYIDAVNESDLDGTLKMQIGNMMELFFESDLKRSLSKLDKALKVLLRELNNGASITLAVKGYASPLADSDYNLNLTYRRIASMENYIMQYDSGAFVRFIDAGQLTIDKIPYGESQAAVSVSDDISDQLGAIYSPTAARERRIEILRIERNE